MKKLVSFVSAFIIGFNLVYPFIYAQELDNNIIEDETEDIIEDKTEDIIEDGNPVINDEIIENISDNSEDSKELDDIIDDDNNNELSVNNVDEINENYETDPKELNNIIDDENDLPINDVDDETIFDDGIILDKNIDNKDIYTFDIEQTEQYIDTSEYGMIRIKDPSNPGKGITIHDRNLGATMTGAGNSASEESYGFYFQWGNNYGFPTTGNIEKLVSYSDANIDASNYGPYNPYSSDTFIYGNIDWTSKINDNLWGGSGDNKQNYRGYPVINPIERQGPCPKGYHVSSIGERNKLLELWDNNNILLGNEGIFQYNDNGFIRYKNNSSDGLNNLINQLAIPITNYRSSNNGNNSSDLHFHIWSSSALVNESYTYHLYGGINEISLSNPFPRTLGHPLRCFYNSYRLPVIVTYDMNGGYWDNEYFSEEVITYTKVDDNSEYTGNMKLIIPKKNNTCGENKDKECMFAGWYLGTGNNSEMWTGNLDGDIRVYAKWLPFEDEDITLSGVNFTIMDRNLGANNSGTGENAYGLYISGYENILCPEGYHIPSTGERKGIGNLLGSNFDGNYIRDLLSLPFAGKYANNGVVGTGEDGYYLAKDGGGIAYAKINNSNIIIENLNNGEKVSARCFKNYNTGTIIFNSNGGDYVNDILAENRREEGKELQKSNRKNSIFLGWYTTLNFQEGTKIERNINYRNIEQIPVYAKWDCKEGYQIYENECKAIYFDITWIDGDNSILKTDKIKYGGIPIYNGTIPTKSNTSDYKYTFNGNRYPEISAVTGDMQYTALFDEEVIQKSGGNSSGGGGRKAINNHGSADSLIQSGAKRNEKISTGEILDFGTGAYKPLPTPLLIGEGTPEVVGTVKTQSISNEDSEGCIGFSQEFIDAYNFAKKYGITAASSIEDAKMYSPLTRIQMAKMLSYFAINVLGKEPDLSKGMIKFSDVSNKLNSEYDNAVTLAYQLGIMGQNMKNNKFRPNDEVTRAEFVTALSRMLYGIKDGTGKTKYYDPHIAKLYNEGIINKSNPNIIEKRGYVMLMLMRFIK